MAAIDSPFTTYSDTTPLKRAITDVISLIDPVDVPLITAMGGLDGATSKFRFVNWPSTTVEWLQDTHAPLADTMSAISVTADSVTLVVTDASLYEPGMIIKMDNEHMWVSSAATATNYVTVTRGVGGTTTATHTSSVAITFIGEARLEGAESTPIAFTDRTVGSNWTQIFHQEVKVTRTQAKISQYGIPDEMAYQRDKAVPSILRLLERHIIYNAEGSAGSATTPRIMGGIQSFVSTNKVSGANLNQTAFENAVMSAYNSGGGGPFVAVCAPTIMQKIKNFYDAPSSGTVSLSVLRVGQDTREAGMKITNIVTPFGDVALLMDRWAMTTIVPILDMRHVGIATYDPFGWNDLAVTGDYQRAEVVGEFTFCLRQEKAHALLTAVT